MSAIHSGRKRGLRLPGGVEGGGFNIGKRDEGKQRGWCWYSIIYWKGSGLDVLYLQSIHSYYIHACLYRGFLLLHDAFTIKRVDKYNCYIVYWNVTPCVYLFVIYFMTPSSNWKNNGCCTKDILKEEIVVDFVVMCRNLSGRSEENRLKSQSA